MTMPSDPFEFEKFPHGWLAFRVTRRRFFPTLLDNLDANSGETPTFGLDELGTWDNDQLATIIPKIIPGAKISLKGGSIFGQPEGTETPIRLFDRNSPALKAFNQINGSISLQDIADKISDWQKWKPEYSFEFVRGLFLWLVLCGVCTPLFPVPEAEP